MPTVRYVVSFFEQSDAKVDTLTLWCVEEATASLSEEVCNKN